MKYTNQKVPTSTHITNQNQNHTTLMSSKNKLQRTTLSNVKTKLLEMGITHRRHQKEETLRTMMPETTTLRILSMNCNSVVGKLNDIKCYVETHKPDLISITETKLGPHIDELMNCLVTNLQFGEMTVIVMVVECLLR